MPLDKTKLTITKFEAARRQLNAAIMLWFADGDEVSIHSLAYAAYEIIHAVSKKHERKIELLFDAPIVNEEYRGEFNGLLKKHANFFKHANRAQETEIEFYPALSELFIFFSIFGVQSMRLALTPAEVAFVLWQVIQDPKFLTDEGRKFFIDTIGVDQIPRLRTLSKQEFLEQCDAARKLIGLVGIA